MRRSPRTLQAAAVILATLCAGCGDEPTGAHPCDASQITPVPCEVADRAVEATGEQVAGSWMGHQSWDVVFFFRADGTFTKTDLIAPCPAGGQCVWSGIVENRGTWKLSGSRVLLQYDAPNTTAGATVPAALDTTFGCETKLVQPLQDGTSIVFLRRGCA